MYKKINSQNTKTSPSSDIISKELGRRIAELRKQQNLTQEQLAEKAGISHQFFSCVERGEKNIRSVNLLKLSRALGVTTDYLLVGVAFPNYENEKVVLLQQIIDKLDYLDVKQLNWLNEVISALTKVFEQNKEHDET